jgi:hypothetical protein
MNKSRDVVRISKLNGRYCVSWFDGTNWHPTANLSFQEAVVAFREAWQKAGPSALSALVPGFFLGAGADFPSLAVQMEIDTGVEATVPIRAPNPSIYRSFIEFASGNIPD